MENLTTKEKNWLKYEKVRIGGAYNMLMEFRQASKAAGLNEKEYMEIIQNYSSLRDGLLQKFSKDELIKLVGRA